MSDPMVKLTLAEQLSDLRLLRQDEFIKKAEKLLGSAGAIVPSDLAEFALRMDQERKEDPMFDETHDVRRRVIRGKESTEKIYGAYGNGDLKNVERHASRAALWAFTAAREAKKNPK